MKTCYMCGGKIERKDVDVEIEGVLVKDMLAEVCSRCGERYFDSKTATFIQKVSAFISNERKQYVEEVVKASI